jgi:hypothetical protein
MQWTQLNHKECQMNNFQQLNEGLRSDDLTEMVRPVFEVDTFKSKMGEDQDVCVISFKVNDRSPAKDLMEFIEKGYGFVLDADISAGEDNSGRYSVFVELARSPKLAEEIKDLMYGVKKLTGVDEFKFKYHKQDSLYEDSEENLKNNIPGTAGDYEKLMDKLKTEGVKRFFNKTLMDDLTIDNNIITIHKPFKQSIQLRWLNELDPQYILEGAPQLDTEATAEIFWLTKVLGDYNINKYNDKLMFVNNDKTMILQRI